MILEVCAAPPEHEVLTTYQQCLSNTGSWLYRAKEQVYGPNVQVHTMKAQQLTEAGITWQNMQHQLCEPRKSTRNVPTKKGL